MKGGRGVEDASVVESGNPSVKKVCDRRGEKTRRKAKFPRFGARVRKEEIHRGYLSPKIKR